MRHPLRTLFCSVAAAALIAVGAGAAPTAASAAPDRTAVAAPAVAATPPLITFKVLFLIYPQVQVPGQPATSFSPAMTTAATTAAGTTWPREISDLTGGQVRVVPTVVVVPHPLTSNERYRNGNNPAVWPSVWPEDIPQDVQNYVEPRGRYDSVIVWDAHPDYNNVTAGGGAVVTDAKVTWSTEGNPGTPSGYAYGSDMLAGAKHEWLHGLSQYYFGEKGLGSRAPQCADDPSRVDGVHCGEDYGYVRTQNGYDNWNSWYRDFLNGAIAGGGKGLGPTAWTKGVPRARFGGPLGGGTGDAQRVIGQGSGRCLDVYGPQSDDGTPTGLWDCTGAANQAWVYTAGQLVNPLTGKCLDVAGQRTADGTSVRLWTCLGNAAQQWVFGANGTVVNPTSGKCLDATGRGTANGTLTQIWSCASPAQPQQVWRLS